ncbi:MAG TPA: type II toxin-antitoxin system HicA family toxin [Chthoniobacter sp.]|jgi:predicted RNA binding protein YcfA (HicA-like mRNA interferase family)
MPRKIRHLITELTRAGFVNRGGKGSHRNFVHPKPVRITLSGKDGDDARQYQVRDVERAIQLAKQK